MLSLSGVWSLGVNIHHFLAKKADVRFIVTLDNMTRYIAKDTARNVELSATKEAYAALQVEYNKTGQHRDHLADELVLLYKELDSVRYKTSVAVKERVRLAKELKAE